MACCLVLTNCFTTDKKRKQQNIFAAFGCSSSITTKKGCTTLYLPANVSDEVSTSTHIKVCLVFSQHNFYHFSFSVLCFCIFQEAGLLFKCLDCSAVFKDRKGLSNHSRMHRVDDNDDALTLTATPSPKKQKKSYIPHFLP